MRPGSELITFVESDMRMSDVYQPAIILELLHEPDFTLPGGDLALHLNPYFPDLDQNELWERLKHTPRQVLESHDVVRAEEDIWKLSFTLDPETARQVAAACSLRIADWRSKRGEVRGWIGPAPRELNDGQSALFLASYPEWNHDLPYTVRPGDRLGWVDPASSRVTHRARILYARALQWIEGTEDELVKWFPELDRIWLGPVAVMDDHAVAFTVDAYEPVDVPIGPLELTDSPLVEADHEVAEKLRSASPHRDPSAPRVWWVNQGQSFDAERAGGYIWAPQRSKGGAALAHHRNVADVKEGDVVVHYAQGAVRALGLATAAGTESDRPEQLSGESWDRPGFQAEIEYFDLAKPINLTEIPDDDRIAAGGPFTGAGNVKQGYLYPLPVPFADLLRTEFSDRWPSGSPWGQSRRQASRQAIAVYVGTAAQENLGHGLEEGVWGWRSSHSDYEEVKAGDLLIFGVGFTGGSPRTNAEEFAKHGLERVIECEITGSVDEYDTPEWPDEIRSGEVRYPFRVSMDTPKELGAFSVVELDAHYGAKVGEALRLSSTQGGRGVLVKVTNLAERRQPDISGTTLEDVCVAASRAIEESGLNYGARHDDLIRSFVVSLATKRFVLLTGLSGSGKSRLGIAFGQWLGEDQYKVVAVRPDWTGPDALLGYENLLSESVDGAHAWVVPETLEFMLQAAGDPDRPYLLLLDEMNLAHVERYFADVLSGIESREKILPDLGKVNGDWRKVGDEKLPFPENLFVVGTVNIDETTYMFSPKVLDRANTMEFRVRTEDLNPDAPRLTDVSPAEAALVSRFLADATDPTVGSTWPGRVELAEALINLHRRLSELDREFGHRVFHESIRFGALLARAGNDDWTAALDLQVMQKVLPRIHGAVKQVVGPLQMLGSWCFYGPEGAEVDGFDFHDPPDGTAVLPVSFDKVRRMHERAITNHFVSFAE